MTCVTVNSLSCNPVLWIGAHKATTNECYCILLLVQSSTTGPEGQLAYFGSVSTDLLLISKGVDAVPFSLCSSSHGHFTLGMEAAFT